MTETRPNYIELAGYPALRGREERREGGRGGEGREGGGGKEGGARAKSPIRPPTLRNITS